VFLSTALLAVAGSREVTAYRDSVVSVKFVVYLPYNDTYVDELMWLGAAVELSGQTIWSAEMNVAVVNTTFSDMVTRRRRRNGGEQEAQLSPRDRTTRRYS